ncbi:Pleckstrin homology domain-containing family A member 7 [Larimichthys crocea]|uniref:Uncharacterized protein n=1 Tax=Larimichthys crocea TaxID=215358 RepID=A0ACD3QCY1_LARCR|nr:Pleckstrin homology domain-containing family A member 7 [Larimichthys crocea]
MDFILQEQPQGACMMSKHGGEQLSSTTVSEASTTITSSTVDTTSASKGSRSSGKVHSFGKREQAIKRNPNVPVVVRGWLYKQDSSGMRLWKRKWFVLADFCLFYYKGPLNTLGPDGRTPAVNLVPHTDRVQNSWYRCRHYKVVRVLADALELEMQIKQPVI